MKTKIIERLHEIQEIYNVIVIYACESGSRAWG
ncbi:MAG: DNA polymerase beta superfamily protein, partial [Anaerolineales bacterium]